MTQQQQHDFLFPTFSSRAHLHALFPQRICGSTKPTKQPFKQTLIPDATLSKPTHVQIDNHGNIWILEGSNSKLMHLDFKSNVCEANLMKNVETIFLDHLTGLFYMTVKGVLYECEVTDSGELTDKVKALYRRTVYGNVLVDSKNNRVFESSSRGLRLYEKQGDFKNTVVDLLFTSTSVFGDQLAIGKILNHYFPSVCVNPVNNDELLVVLPSSKLAKLNLKTRESQVLVTDAERIKETTTFLQSFRNYLIVGAGTSLYYADMGLPDFKLILLREYVCPRSMTAMDVQPVTGEVYMTYLHGLNRIKLVEDVFKARFPADMVIQFQL